MFLQVGLTYNIMFASWLRQGMSWLEVPYTLAELKNKDLRLSHGLLFIYAWTNRQKKALMAGCYFQL